MPTRTTPGAAGHGLSDLDAATIVAGYRDGRWTPVEVLAAVMARVRAVDDHVHALWAPDPDGASAAAEASTRRWADGAALGPLDGVPVTVKENIATRGTPVPGGTAATVLEPAEADAPPAARLREAGAVLVAKTTMPDWGMLSSGRSSFHDLARNPWDLDWNPGGSSAGAAAAGAAGYGPLHLGSDIGGSIRLPAGWCGLVGLKPSWGRVPIDPPYWGRVVGPITRTAADAAVLLAVLARPDPDDRDFQSLPPDPGLRDVDAVAAGFGPPSSVAGLRVGLHLDAGAGLAVDDEVVTVVRRVADTFADAGAGVEVVAPFLARHQLAGLDRFWRVRGWADWLDLDEDARGRVLPYIRDWVHGGADVDGVEVLRAAQQMLAVGRDTLAATRAFDVVVSPVSPVATFPAEWHGPTDDPDTAMHHIAFTVPYNFSHQPAVSVHAGVTADGRPVGVQLAGPRFADLDVLRLAAWWESVRPADATPTWPAPAVAALVATDDRR